jgi:hypothetical protein
MLAFWRALRASVRTEETPQSRMRPVVGTEETEFVKKYPRSGV